MIRSYLLFILLFSFETVRADAFLCRQLFATHQTTQLSVTQSKALMKPTQIDKNSTTSARVEEKYSVDVNQFNAIMKAFKGRIEKEILNFKLANRDALVEGQKNVTLTTYSNRFQLNFTNGKPLIAKIRFRKYGLIEQSKPVTKENFKVSDFMKDVSFLEFKIENPDYEHSVLKPRIKIYDRDRDLIMNSSFTKTEMIEIFNRTVAINKTKIPSEQAKINETISTMLMAIKSIHDKKSLLRPEFETLYERTSYVVPVTIKATGQVLDVQITIDASISARSLVLERDTDIYKNNPNVVVDEIKIPIPLLQYLADGRSQEVTGLTSVVALMKDLENNHIAIFDMSSGKLHHLRRELEGSP